MKHWYFLVPFSAILMHANAVSAENAVLSCGGQCSGKGEIKVLGDKRKPSDRYIRDIDVIGKASASDRDVSDKVLKKAAYAWASRVVDDTCERYDMLSEFQYTVSESCDADDTKACVVVEKHRCYDLETDLDKLFGKGS